MKIKSPLILIAAGLLLAGTVFAQPILPNQHWFIKDLPGCTDYAEVVKVTTEITLVTNMVVSIQTNTTVQYKTFYPGHSTLGMQELIYPCKALLFYGRLA